MRAKRAIHESSQSPRCGQQHDPALPYSGFAPRHHHRPRVWRRTPDRRLSSSPAKSPTCCGACLRRRVSQPSCPILADTRTAAAMTPPDPGQPGRHRPHAGAGRGRPAGWWRSRGWPMSARPASRADPDKFELTITLPAHHLSLHHLYLAGALRRAFSTPTAVLVPAFAPASSTSHESPPRCGWHPISTAGAGAGLAWRWAGCCNCNGCCRTC